jgi:PAS domain S-box-containing protein
LTREVHKVTVGTMTSREHHGVLAGVTLQPGELEAEYRNHFLRGDVRAASTVAGFLCVLACLNAVNDPLFITDRGTLWTVLGLRGGFLLITVGLIWVSLQTRKPAALDGAVLVWVSAAALLSVVVQSTRPSSYYLPVVETVLSVVLVWVLFPTRYWFQLLGAFILTGATIIWLVAFRNPPPRPEGRFIAIALLAANVAGAFVSWRLHRSRRLQFLAVREQATLVTRLSGREKELQDSEEHFRGLVRSLPIPLLYGDMDARILTVNDRFTQVLGYTLAEIPTGEIFFRLVYPDEVYRQSVIRSWSEAVRRAVADHVDIPAQEHRVTCKDGTVRVMQISGATIGKNILVTFLDVTDRNRAEAALRENESRLRGFFDSPLMGIAITSPEKGWLEVNDRLCSMLGYSREELVHRTWAELTHPDDLAADVEEFNRLLEGEIDRYTMDKRFVRKDGSVVWTALSVSCVRTSDYQVDYVVAFLMDIGKRKAALAALHESEARFRTLASQSPVGIFQTDTSGRVTFLNRTMLGITGLPEGKGIGSEWTSAVHPDDREAVYREWQVALASGTVFTTECRVLTSQGKTAWVRAYASALRGGTGAILGYIGVVIDITEQRALQSQLAVASRLASMGTLVAGVAHEINNPLAGSMASLAMATATVRELMSRHGQDEPLDREAATDTDGEILALLDDARTGTERIARIVKDLSLFGRPDPQRRMLRLMDVVNAAMRWLPGSVGRAATIRVEDQGAPDVMASAGQLEQVIVNLVSNAARAAHPDRPLCVRVIVGKGDPGLARIDVVDDGVGMPPDVLARIFDPFFTTREVGTGTGLGLSICHAIVTAHGGTLIASSTPGRGSTFRMELPVAQRE